MLTKLIRLFLLLCLSLLILSGALLQTDFAKRKIISWIEKKTEGALVIGKLEGFLPFWLNLTDVSYQTEELAITLNKATVTLSPGSLLLGHLSILNLHIDRATIHSSPSEGTWPSYPFPIRIHSLEIDSFTYNTYEDLHLEGMVDLDEDFSFNLSVTSPKLPDVVIYANVKADSVNQILGVISSVKKGNEMEFWLSGEYVWQADTFIGSFQGKTPLIQMSADLEFKEKDLLNISSFQATFKNTSLQGELAYSLSSQQLTASGSFLNRPFKLQTVLSFSDESVSASPLALHYSDDHLRGGLTFSFDDTSLTGALDLEINDLTPFPTEHSIGGTARAHIEFVQNTVTFFLDAKQIAWKELFLPYMSVTGAWKEGNLSFDLNFQELTVLDPAYEVFPQVHLQLTGNATLEQISVAGNLYGLGDAPFSLACTLPINFSLNPLDIAINQEAPFSLQLQGHGSIDPILEFLENASLIARGTLDLELIVSGTWKNPHLEGYLVYSNGWVESLTTGAIFRAIHMEMEAEGRELKIRSLIAHDVDKGDLVGNGSIIWNPSGGFPFTFNLFASRYVILALDPFTASVNAEITLSGTIREMTIAGKAIVVNAHMAIPNKMPVQVPVVEVRYINALEAPLPEKKEKEIPIHWDLAIDVPRNLTIDGRGLTSEWSGTLKITGEQNALSYSGKLKLIQGRFAVINRTFDLVEGKVRIEGLEPKNVYVDLKGDYELPNLTASIVVSGSLDQTHLSFCSNPPMSTNQILSWILFNQDINELTPFQACRLASLLVSISGTYSGPKTFSNIKEGLGIDVFSITDCDIDSADLTFQVGKYISEGTFVGINKSISGDFDSVLIQTRLYRDFYLEADYGGSLNGLTPNGGKAILKWYKSY